MQQFLLEQQMTTYPEPKLIGCSHQFGYVDQRPFLRRNDADTPKQSTPHHVILGFSRKYSEQFRRRTRAHPLPEPFVPGPLQLHLSKQDQSCSKRSVNKCIKKVVLWCTDENKTSMKSVNLLKQLDSIRLDQIGCNVTSWVELNLIGSNVIWNSIRCDWNERARI